MAQSKNAAPPADTKGEDTADTGKSDDTKPEAFDWDTLPEAIAMPNRQMPSVITANVLETVPNMIRIKAEASLAINAERVAAKVNSEAKRARVDYHWDLQPVPNAKVAGEFDKLITKYAKYRPSDKPVPHAGEKSPKGQVTARTGDPGWFIKDSAGNWIPGTETVDGAVYGLRYSVRPFERRGDTKRLPGTA